MTQHKLRVHENISYNCGQCESKFATVHIREITHANCVDSNQQQKYP